MSKYHSMEYLKWFYELSLFVLPEALETEGSHPEYEKFPFTEANVIELMEYQRNCDDLYLLEQIVRESSQQRDFTYFGEKYTGVNVPIEQHRELLDSSLAKCKEIARHCNYWIRKNSAHTYLADRFEMMLETLFSVSDLSSIRSNMDVIYQQIYAVKDESTKAKEYVKSVDEQYRKITENIVKEDENGVSGFTRIASILKVEEDVIDNVRKYFSKEQCTTENMLSSYQNLYSILMTFKCESWEMIARELVIPGKSPLPSKLLEENEEYFS